MKLNLPRYTYSEVGRIASIFLKEHHPSLEIPIPVSVYENLPYNSPEEFVQWRLHVPPEEIGWFETHGNWFAGHLLVPTSCLEEVCRDIVLKYQDTFSEFDSIPDDIWSYISNEVATYFDVNPPVVEAQIKKESIIQKIPIRGKDLKP